MAAPDLSANRAWAHARKGEAFALKILNAGGAAASWSLIGTTPTGLSITGSSATDCDLGGTLTVFEEQTFTVRAHNADGDSDLSLKITVVEAKPGGHFQSIYPLKPIAATELIGVKAKDRIGVASVAFTFDGVSQTTATEETINDYTGWPAHNCTFNPALYSVGEIVTIEATITTTDGFVRVLTMDVQARPTINDIYVDPSGGSDVTGDGSSGNPWATLYHAILAAIGSFGSAGNCRFNLATANYDFVGSDASNRNYGGLPIYIRAWSGHATDLSVAFTTSSLGTCPNGLVGVVFDCSAIKIQFGDGVNPINLQANNSQTPYIVGIGPGVCQGAGRTVSDGTQFFAADPWSGGRYFIGSPLGHKLTDDTTALIHTQDKFWTFRDVLTPPSGCSLYVGVLWVNIAAQECDTGGQTLLQGCRVHNNDLTGTGAHSDFLKIAGTGGDINVIRANCLGTLCGGNTLLLRNGSSDATNEGIFDENNAVANGTMTGPWFESFGQSISGAVVEHCSMPEYPLYVRTVEGVPDDDPEVHATWLLATASIFDQAHLEQLDLTVANDNNIVTDCWGMSSSFGANPHSGGTTSSLFEDYAEGDFTPKVGGGLEAQVTRSCKYDLNGTPRDATTAIGAVAGPSENGGVVPPILTTTNARIQFDRPMSPVVVQSSNGATMLSVAVVDSALMPYGVSVAVVNGLPTFTGTPRDTP